MPYDYNEDARPIRGLDDLMEFMDYHSEDALADCLVGIQSGMSNRDIDEEFGPHHTRVSRTRTALKQLERDEIVFIQRDLAQQEIKKHYKTLDQFGDDV